MDSKRTRVAGRVVWVRVARRIRRRGKAGLTAAYTLIVSHKIIKLSHACQAVISWCDPQSLVGMIGIWTQ